MNFRVKFHKLKYGQDAGNELGKPPDLEPEPPELQSAGSDEPISSQVSWRQGRQLLRQYLQEIGYTDTIIDVRANRVRSLLGLEAPEQQSQQENGGSENKRPAPAEPRRPQKKVDNKSMVRFSSFI